MNSPALKIGRAVLISCLFSLAAFAYQTDTQEPTPPAPVVTSSAPAEQPASPQAQPDQPAKTKVLVRQKPAKQKPNSPKSGKKHAARQDPNSPPSVPSALVGIDIPEKKVIRNGGAQDIRLQLSPTSTPEQIAARRRQTHELLAVSTENLKKISQQELNANQQDMLEQVHNYMNQAKVADKSGELQRAVVLASKARQLSDDLVGARIFPKLWPW
ncbi:MAG TPA: hypothetical protein VGF44_03635 [Terriglobales bacterium]